MRFTDGQTPRRPCETCGGREFWRGCPGSTFWRCSKCQPPEAAYAARQMPRNLERCTIPEEPARA